MGRGFPNLACFYDPLLPEFFESSLDCGAFPVGAVYTNVVGLWQFMFTTTANHTTPLLTQLGSYLTLEHLLDLNTVDEDLLTHNNLQPVANDFATYVYYTVCRLKINLSISNTEHTQHTCSTCATNIVLITD